MEQHVAFRRPYLTVGARERRQEQLPRQLAEACVAGFYRAYRGTGYYNRNNTILDRMIADYIRTVNVITKSAEGGGN